MYQGDIAPHGDLVMTVIRKPQNQAKMVEFPKFPTVMRRTPTHKVEIVRADGTLEQQEAIDPSLTWKFHNQTRKSYLTGEIITRLSSKLNRYGFLAIVSDLQVIHHRADGALVDYGVVSRRVVTNNGVAFIVDAFQGTVEPEIINYHGSGTGTNAEDQTDSALQTESTTALNPDSTRATGTQSEPSANIYRSTGTLTYDATTAVTEHGIFSQAATGGGVLFDRSVFSAVNVVSGESIQFQYSVTFPANG